MSENQTFSPDLREMNSVWSLNPPLVSNLQLGPSRFVSGFSKFHAFHDRNVLN